MPDHDQFLKEFYSLGPTYRGDDEVLVGGRTAITADDRGHSIRLSAIRSLNPGLGHGTQALQQVADLADKHGVTLSLTPGPLDKVENPKEYTKRLVGFYKRFGFRGDADGMIRRPKGTARYARLYARALQLIRSL